MKAAEKKKANRPRLWIPVMILLLAVMLFPSCKAAAPYEQTNYVMGSVMQQTVYGSSGKNAAAEAYSAIRRGDMTGMSFAFVVNKDNWEDLDAEKPLRRISRLSEIYEVSLVAFPAYKGTSVQVASEGDALESVRASLESARKQAAEERAAAEAAEEAERARKAEEERRAAAFERLEKLQKEVRAWTN